MWTDGHNVRQTDNVWTDKMTSLLVDGKMDGLTNGWNNGRVDKWTRGWTHKQTDAWAKRSNK